jgi:transposase
MSYSQDERRARRRARADQMREQGTTVQSIAAALGVSRATVVRDLAAHERAGREAILAALAGEPRPGRKPPRRLAPDERDEARRDKFWRQYHARRLARRGFTYREIAEQVDASPATVMRDLRGDLRRSSGRAHARLGGHGRRGG